MVNAPDLRLQIQRWEVNGIKRVDCPEEEPDPRSNAFDLVENFWKVEILPIPSLSIEPKRGITGKRVYLAMGNEQTKRFVVDNPLGDQIIINARSRYEIDWGDPHSDEDVVTTRSQGGPWPDGDVTYVYTHTGTVTIRVTQHWTATWQSGGLRGELTELETRASLPNFRIREVQAVRQY